jgi:hypothetical protein
MVVIKIGRKIIAINTGNGTLCLAPRRHDDSHKPPANPIFVAKDV